MLAPAAEPFYQVAGARSLRGRLAGPAPAGPVGPASAAAPSPLVGLAPSSGSAAPPGLLTLSGKPLRVLQRHTTY